MRTFVGCIALSLPTILMLGCKSTEEETNHLSDIASDVDKLQVELKDGIYQIDGVTGALGKLATAKGDLRPPFTAFKTSVADLDVITARIRSLGKSLKSKQAAYESTWKEEIETVESANLRSTAERGHAAVEASFHSLQEKSDILGTRFREWEAKVRNVESSLEADLSTSALKSHSKTIKEIGTDAEEIKEGLRTFTEDLGALSSSMRSSAG
jgi:hypothetical protein